MCRKCYNKHLRTQNPVKYSYQTLKDNSKRRNKEFNLTLEEFTEFCIKTDYLIGKGKRKESYSIDRRDNTKGYTLDNIRIMTLSENSRKSTKTLEVYYCEYERKLIATVRSNNIELGESDDCPF